MKIYIDGRYYAREEAKISVFDHGLLYGDGIFEGIRIYHNRIFKLKAHLERLYNSARALMLEIPHTLDELTGIVRETVRLNARENGYIRLVVTRGIGDLGVNPGKCPAVSVIVIVDDIQLYPKDYYTKGIAIMVASVRRVSADIFDPRIKSLNYLNNVLARIEANQAGCLEAVLLNREGYVTECTGDNIFIVKSGKLVTPPAYAGILLGITRQTVFELAASLKLECIEANLTCYDLYTADECFLTGTGAEIIPVISVSGRRVGEGRPGRITLQLLEEFRKRIAEETD